MLWAWYRFRRYIMYSYWGRDAWHSTLVSWCFLNTLSLWCFPCAGFSEASLLRWILSIRAEIRRLAPRSNISEIGIFWEQGRQLEWVSGGKTRSVTLSLNLWWCGLGAEGFLWQFWSFYHSCEGFLPPESLSPRRNCRTSGVPARRTSQITAAFWLT